MYEWRQHTSSKHTRPQRGTHTFKTKNGSELSKLSPNFRLNFTSPTSPRDDAEILIVCVQFECMSIHDVVVKATHKATRTQRATHSFKPKNGGELSKLSPNFLLLTVKSWPPSHLSCDETCSRSPSCEFGSILKCVTCKSASINITNPIQCGNKQNWHLQLSVRRMKVFFAVRNFFFETCLLRDRFSLAGRKEDKKKMSELLDHRVTLPWAGIASRARCEPLFLAWLFPVKWRDQGHDNNDSRKLPAFPRGFKFNFVFMNQRHHRVSVYFPFSSTAESLNFHVSLFANQHDRSGLLRWRWKKMKKNRWSLSGVLPMTLNRLCYCLYFQLTLDKGDALS